MKQFSALLQNLHLFSFLLCWIHTDHCTMFASLLYVRPRRTRLLFEKYLPVDDFIFVKVLESENNTGSVEDGARLCEDVGVDVHHEVPACRVLHHEAHVALKTITFNKQDRRTLVQAAGGAR